MEAIMEYLASSILSEVRILESKIILAALEGKTFEQVEKLHIDKANRERIARLIRIPEKDWHLHGEVFADFDIFSKYLSESSLNTDERAKACLHFIRKNIACGIFEQEMVAFDAPKMMEYKFKYITPDECRELIQTEKFYELKNKDYINLSEHEKKQLEDVEGFIEANPLDISDIVQKHRIIQEHYFDKAPNLTEDDLKKVIIALYGLRFSSITVRCIRTYIASTCKIVNDKPKEVITPVVINKEPKKEMLSKKEYYVLEQELKKYFDIDNMEAIRMLTWEEEIRSIAIMKKMQLPKYIIENVIRIIKKTRAIGKVNPIEHYLYMYAKIKHYSNNVEVSNKLKDLEKHFQDIFILDDDTYIIYKEYLRLLIDEVNDLIPDSYDYEYEEADKYELKMTR